MSDKTLIVGGSGFIGRAMQRFALERGFESYFTFTYNKGHERIQEGLDKFQADLLEECPDEVSNYSRAIYLAGNADHGLAKRDPSLDLRMNAISLLNFLRIFRGSLVVLSTQAVYYGLQGEINERVDHVPTIPYGISKRTMESYAEHFLREGYLTNLWVFRLMYAFGEGEKERRLIPLCARAAARGGEVKIYGGGRSYINPLEASFVARVLAEAAHGIGDADEGFKETTNLNHPEVITVADMVRFLNNQKKFAHIFEDSGEEWPVEFWGNTANLSAHLNTWGMNFPAPWDCLRDYFLRRFDEVVRK